MQKRRTSLIILNKGFSVQLLKFVLKVITLLIALEPCLIRANARQRADDSPSGLVHRIQRSKRDSDKIKLELKLGEYYLNKQGQVKINLDSASVILTQAKQLSDSLHLIKWQMASLRLQGNYYIQRSDLKRAKSCFMEIIDHYIKTGEQLQQAQTWSYFGDCIFTLDADSRVQEKKCYEMAYRLFTQLHDKPDAISALINLADQHLRDNELDQAEKQLNQAVAEYHAINYKKLAYPYSLLAEVNRLKGNPNKQLYYSLEVIKAMNATADTGYASYYYYKLAMVYKDLKMHDKTEFYLLKTLAQLRRERDFFHYHNMVADYVQDLIEQDQPESALHFLQARLKEALPQTDRQQYFVYRGFGLCYQALGQYSRAERCFLGMIRLSDIQSHDNILYLHTHLEDYELIARFYVNSRQYAKARIYLNKIQSMPADKTSPSTLSKIQLLFFKTDSASKRYLSAITHYQLYKKLNDSIFSVAKNKEVEEVQLKYETAQKDEALLLQKKDIQILKKETQIEKNKAEKSLTFRNFSIILSIMLLVILGLGYNRYRMKQQSNELLETNQRIISAKNSGLEKSLRDNEWLLKEVHHRVKNNLQLITSLLQSQSVYLHDKAAITAVKESRQRVLAMSIVHQKLYKTENNSDIFMPEYISELVANLKDTFKEPHFVVFDVQADPISLNVIQAIPVGLILNEAITNALKYAFPAAGDHTIRILLKGLGSQRVSLLIADNGCGMPKDFDMNGSKSFGMILMNGLSEDLDGTFTIFSREGTSVELKFESQNYSSFRD